MDCFSLTFVLNSVRPGTNIQDITSELMYRRKCALINAALVIKILIIFSLILSDVLDDRLHDLLPTIRLHRVDVLHNL